MSARKETKKYNSKFPLILELSSAGDPVRWITYEDAAYYYAKDRVLWSLGQHNVTLHGGTNVVTGTQSILTMDTIIAIRSPPTTKLRQKNPKLSNLTLFQRDGNMCAYCGGIFKSKDLTRDHVIPTSRGGKDSWENCVTCCKTCNNWKADRLIEEVDLTLRYNPYMPSHHELLIFKNRKLLDEQREYLMKGVSKTSRIYETIAVAA